jgi:hypothetical protein
MYIYIYIIYIYIYYIIFRLGVGGRVVVRGR